MLRGDRVGLRARYQADVPVLHSELYDDVVTRSRADTRPWRPINPGSAASPFAVTDPTDDAAVFSVVELAGDDLAGEALLWNIDPHNRTAHLGISLRPAFRGRGLGTDVVRVLCTYGFAVRGLHRLQVDTLADHRGGPGGIHAGGHPAPLGLGRRSLRRRGRPRPARHRVGRGLTTVSSCP